MLESIEAKGFSLYKVLQDHKANPPEKDDLVQVMLNGRDKETGLGLPEDNIRNNVRFYSPWPIRDASDSRMVALDFPHRGYVQF